MILSEADTLLAPVTEIDGFVLACLVDASTGMVLASRQASDGMRLPPVAAGAADIFHVLSLLGGQLAPGEARRRHGDVQPAFPRHMSSEPGSGRANCVAGRAGSVKDQSRHGPA